MSRASGDALLEDKCSPADPEWVIVTLSRHNLTLLEVLKTVCVPARLHRYGPSCARPGDSPRFSYFKLKPGVARDTVKIILEKAGATEVFFSFFFLGILSLR